MTKPPEPPPPRPEPVPFVIDPPWKAAEGEAQRRRRALQELDARSQGKVVR